MDEINDMIREAGLDQPVIAQPQQMDESQNITPVEKSSHE